MNKEKDNPNSKELAEDRTDFAEDRTMLANERTFNSWMGVALGNLGMAVALQAVFGKTEPTWLAKLAASIFVFLALMIIVIGYFKTAAACERLSSHTTKPAETGQLLLVATVLSIGSLGIGLILWML